MSNQEMTPVENRIAEKINVQSTGKLAVGETRLQIRDMSQLMDFAKVMAVGGVAVPKHLRGNPGACIAICLQAIEWEMSPFSVANKSYLVNDRIAFEAQLINAVIQRRAPIKGRPVYEYSGDGANLTCRVTVTANNGQKLDYTSPPVGKITPQNSPLWKSDPQQQLGYYSVRALARRHFPDVILGVIEREEATVIDHDDQEVQQPAQQPLRAGTVEPPARRSYEQKLDDLAGDEPFDQDTGEVIGAALEGEAGYAATGVAEDPAPAAGAPPPGLLAAARKGTRALKMAVGKLSEFELGQIPADTLESLKRTAAIIDRNNGDSEA